MDSKRALAWTATKLYPKTYFLSVIVYDIPILKLEPTQISSQHCSEQRMETTLVKLHPKRAPSFSEVIYITFKFSNLEMPIPAVTSLM